ncbi:hypothetical protein LX36DRAFT_651834 [Colletotrichum falcatum]|nr:hypothetical protein LX36DRAFT_651834 [Colletotrichum falcatum]
MTIRQIVPHQGSASTPGTPTLASPPAPSKPVPNTRATSLRHGETGGPPRTIPINPKITSSIHPTAAVEETRAPDTNTQFPRRRKKQCC